MKCMIIDYGMGNLKNVQKAFQKIGVEAEISSDPEEILRADKVVLPGVGAFCQAMETLRTSGLEDVIKCVAERGTPLLGICLGMQLLFEKSFEHGEYEGLGLLKGTVIKLDVPYKIPHMGWNTLEITKRSPLFEAVDEMPYVYFVHSYHVSCDETLISAYTDYGKPIPVAVQHNNLFGMQYHPEKSSTPGLSMLKAFAAL